MKHTYIEQHVEDFGNRVVCDVCFEDYGNSDESGGFLFSSYAYCPKCASRSLADIKRYKEEKHIKAWCPKGMSFRDWCLALRRGDNTVRTTTIERRDE